MDTISRIDSMRAQESTTSSCYYYFQGNASKEGIDEGCRKTMVEWCQKVQRVLRLSPETAWIAISFFDRYLSSGKGNSSQALNDRYNFQLAAITSFYIAMKIHESLELNVAKFAKLCKGYYAEEDIVSMEEDILFALDWRVTCPTPMDFARHFMQLLPEKISTSISNSLLQTCKKHLERTSTDFYFTFFKPSVIGASCLASALTGTDILSSSERHAFWFQLAHIVDLIEVMEVQKQLFKSRRPCKLATASASYSKPRIISQVVTPSQLKTAGASEKSSPACVSQTTGL